MNETKLYLVNCLVSSHYSLRLGISVPEGLFSSKFDADMYVWSKNNEKPKRTILYSTYSRFYSVTEVNMLKNELSPKLQREFVRSKIEELQKDLEKETKDSEESKKRAEVIRSELEGYTKFL